MDKFITTIRFLSRNWKLVLILFGLGGSVTVLSVVPGTEAVQDAANKQVDAVKAKLVVPAEAEAPAAE